MHIIYCPYHSRLWNTASITPSINNKKLDAVIKYSHKRVKNQKKFIKIWLELRNYVPYQMVKKLGHWFDLKTMLVAYRYVIIKEDVLDV